MGAQEEVTDINERMMKTLQEVLKQVEAGEIQNLAVVFSSPDGNYVWQIEGPNFASYGMLGAISNMQHYLNEIINELVRQRGEETKIYG